MNIIKKPKLDFFIDYGFVFIGMFVLITGVIMGIDYEYDVTIQTAVVDLKTSYFLVGVADTIMTLGYWVLIFSGGLIAVIGYMLQRI